MEVWIRVANARAKRCTQVRLGAYNGIHFLTRDHLDITFGVSEMHSRIFYPSQIGLKPESFLLSGHGGLRFQNETVRTAICVPWTTIWHGMRRAAGIDTNARCA